MVIDVMFLFACLLLILFCCIVFVNAVELLGKALNLHQGIVGSILAAVGTALPETIIPIIAIMFSPGKEAHNVGIGAIAGAPFMLGTLAFLVTGAAILIYSLLGKRSRKMSVDIKNLERDLTFFLIYYGIAVGATFFHEQVALKVVIALALLASYPLYLRWTIKSDCKQCEIEDDLYLSKFFRLPATLPFIILQLTLSLVVLVVAAHFFVVYVQNLSAAIGVPAIILSLIITPIATELPEKLNSVIWVGKGKDTLALGNITGAMVFQSCFPVVFGMVFTDWHLQGATLVSAICALVSAAMVLIWIRLKKSLNPFLLCFGGVFYCVLIFYISFSGK
jgi:cation:H+ antiporter